MIGLKYLPIAVLIGSKAHTLVVISNSIGVVICWGNIGINWGRSIGRCRCISRCRSIDWGRSVDRCRGILGGSRGNSQKSRQSNKALEESKLYYML